MPRPVLRPRPNTGCDLTAIHLVITSIAPPGDILRQWAVGAGAAGVRFIVIGDTKSPPDFRLDGCEFYGIEAQKALGLTFAEACPVRHYARKNIGYLLALRARAPMIVETDDDNFPYPAFWQARTSGVTVPCLDGAGWTNVYRYFTEVPIWPRGFPLESVHAAVPEWSGIGSRTVHCPIQQGLADDNPDVDAVYRMVMPLPVRFRADRRIALGPGSWCPFNSQNTAWWPEAYPLLYLPAYCPFRMTDIWRSLVAQRIAWENGWAVLFHEPTVAQIRNEHDLLKDFEDEVPGYLANARIARILADAPVRGGIDHMLADLRVCYGALAGAGIFPREELALLDAWIADVEREAA